MITPIEAIARVSPSAPAAKVSDPTGGFADIFKTAVESVVETDAEKNRLEYLLSTGQLDNPAELSIAGTKAELSVSLLVQLRNRALDAYSELSRISL